MVIAARLGSDVDASALPTGRTPEMEAYNRTWYGKMA
jgi:hypothetical protein